MSETEGAAGRGEQSGTGRVATATAARLRHLASLCRGKLVPAERLAASPGLPAGKVKYNWVFKYLHVLTGA